ncbi:MAG: hypothetical protein WBS54_15610 [Acidobacteriota bacterium]
MFKRHGRAGEAVAHSGKGWVALAFTAGLILLEMAAGGQGPPASSPWLPFQGNWSAAGNRRVLPMGPDRRAAIFDLSGSLVLTSQQGLGLGFTSEAVGFYNGRDRVVAECVWTDDKGDQIFSELKGQALRAESHVTGTITGGTGRYEGITGDYEFDWRYVVHTPEGVLQGWAVGLTGRTRKIEPAAGRASR